MATAERKDHRIMISAAKTAHLHGPATLESSTDSKLEIYALAADISREVADIAISEPLKDLGKSPEDTVQREVWLPMFLELKNVSDARLKLLEKRKDKRYARLTTLLKHFRADEEIVTSWRGDPKTRFAVKTRIKALEKPTGKYGGDPASLVAAGINTAIAVFAATDHLIVDLHQNTGKKFSSSDLISVLNNSYPLPVYLASNNIETFTKLMVHVSKDLTRYDEHATFRPENFELVNESVRLRPELLQLAENVIPDEPTYGCPAIVNYGDGSAIKKLWEWHLPLVTQVYERRFPTQ